MIIHDEINEFVGSVKKVYIITISQDSWDISWKLKTFSYDNCYKDSAHSQSVIMHEKNHARTNQFVVSVQKVYIITINEDAWGKSCKLKTYLCSNCNNNFAHSQSVIIHDKNQSICRKC